MTKLDLTKKAVSVVVGLGTSKIVGDIIKNNVSPEKTHEIVTVYAGSFVLGSMVADISRQYTDQKIDEIAKWWTENITPKLNK